MEAKLMNLALKANKENNMPTIKVNGMHCEHCKAAVEKAVKAIPGVKSATVDLDKKELQYEEEDKNMPIALKIIMGAISDLGYEPVDQRP